MVLHEKDQELPASYYKEFETQEKVVAVAVEGDKSLVQALPLSCHHLQTASRIFVEQQLDVSDWGPIWHYL